MATVGPSSEDEAVIESLIGAGVDIFRLNFSYGSREQHRETFERIRRVTAKLDTWVAVLQDIAGPKIRMGDIAGGSTELTTGWRFRFERDLEEGDSTRAGFRDEGWFNSVEVGHRVVLGDGNVIMQVLSRDEAGLDCEVISGGTVRSRNGLNFPDSNLTLGAITEKDWRDIDFGLELGVDAMALSFVSGPEDVVAVRERIAEHPHPPMLVPKIELPAAVESFEQILEVADGIMVARGDLGLTIPLERIPAVQKRLIREAREAGRFVITATQMLESMTRAPQPTRAEVTDVANAVFDGTDAVMLSGETAIGRHPVRVVETMAKILREAELTASFAPLEGHDGETRSAIAMAARLLVEQLDVKAVIIPFTYGSTARLISRQRLPVPVVTGLESFGLGRALKFWYGVFLFHIAEGESSVENLKLVIERTREWGWIGDGDRIVSVGGLPFCTPGNTNFLRVHVVGRPL